jgi:hypothetical protein
MGERGIRRGGGRCIQDKHSMDVESPPFFASARLWVFTLKVSHSPISVVCLFSMTLLPGGVGRAPSGVDWARRHEVAGRRIACRRPRRGVLSHPARHRSVMRVDRSAFQSIIKKYTRYTLGSVSPSPARTRASSENWYSSSKVNNYKMFMLIKCLVRLQQK